MGKFTIWSNNLDYSDWKNDLEELYPDYSDEDRISLMYDINNRYLEDERVNLDIQLDRPILVIADLGRWNGRFSGYKEIRSGRISDCLYSNTDYCTWYVDAYKDLRCDAVHHDGTNHYLYRTYKENVSDTQIENLKTKIFEGTVTRRDITRITRRIGDAIASVYGL